MTNRQAEATSAGQQPVTGEQPRALLRVAAIVESAITILSMTIAGGWAFYFAFYERLHVDPFEVGIANTQVMIRSAAISMAALALGVLALLPPPIRKKAQDGIVLTDALFVPVFLASQTCVLVGWGFLFSNSTAWRSSRPILYVPLLIIGLCIASMATAYVVIFFGPQNNTKKPSEASHRFGAESIRREGYFVLAAIVLGFIVAGFVAGYRLADRVLLGSEVQLGLFRVEITEVSFLDGTDSMCMHYLGSNEGVAVFFDADDEKNINVVRVSLENVSTIRRGHNICR